MPVQLPTQGALSPLQVLSQRQQRCSVGVDVGHARAEIHALLLRGGKVRAETRDLICAGTADEQKVDLGLAVLTRRVRWRGTGSSRPRAARIGATAQTLLQALGSLPRWSARLSPRFMIVLGTALSGLGWVAASKAESLLALYGTYGLLCGLGTGIVYVGIVGLMVRWFPDRRGSATGIVATGCGSDRPVALSSAKRLRVRAAVGRCILCLG